MAMVERRTAGERVFDAVNYTILTLLTIVCLYPMLYVFFASISDPIQLMHFNGFLYKPLGFTLDGYNVVLKNPNVPVGYMNTIFYVVAGTLLNLLMTVLGGYALSRRGYKLKKIVTIIIIFTMYFSGGLIPSFLLVKNIGIYDTRLALLLPSAISTWNLIIMKTVFQGVPLSLEESTRLDGANDFTILFKVFIPVSKATIAVMILFYAVGHWNSWFDAMVYLRDRQKYPLQLFMREILISNSQLGNLSGEISADGDGAYFLNEIIKYSTIIIGTVPILFVYPFAQKHFVKGVMMGSLKE